MISYYCFQYLICRRNTSRREKRSLRKLKSSNNLSKKLLLKVLGKEELEEVEEVVEVEEDKMVIDHTLSNQRITRGLTM